MLKYSGMKPFGIIKSILYFLGGVLVLVLNGLIMERAYVGVVVGLVVLSYAVDSLIFGIISKNLLTRVFIYTMITHVLLAVVLFIVVNNLTTVCLVWAVWTILREGNEIAESIHRIMKGKAGFINITESVVVIVFAFMMILEPTEHHAHVHIIILGIELLLEAVFPYLNIELDALLKKMRLSKKKDSLENKDRVCGPAAPENKNDETVPVVSGLDFESEVTAVSADESGDNN